MFNCVQVRRWFQLKPRGHQSFDLQCPCALNGKIAFAASATVHCEVQEMAPSIAAIKLSLFNAAHPSLISGIPHGATVEAYIAAAHAHPLVGDAGVVSFADERHAETAVHHVVPGI